MNSGVIVTLNTVKLSSMLLQFLAEIEMETGRGRATYAEVEESEADLERFEKWLTAIANRDYFDAPR